MYFIWMEYSIIQEMVSIIIQTVGQLSGKDEGVDRGGGGTGVEGAESGVEGAESGVEGAGSGGRGGGDRGGGESRKIGAGN